MGADISATRTSGGVGTALGELFDLASGASDAEAFYGEALDVIARRFASPFALLSTGDRGRTIELEHHTGSNDPSFWRDAVSRFMFEGLAGEDAVAKRFSARNAELQVAMIFCPFVNCSEETSGGIALVLEGGDTATVSGALTELDALTTAAGKAARLAGRQATAGTAVGSDNSEQFEALSRASTYGSDRRLAFAITNNLRSRADCEQAGLALVKGRGVRILSVAGVDDMNPRSPGLERLRAAMEECIDAGQTVVSQEADRWKDAAADTGHRLHRRWRDESGSGAVASIPLKLDNRTVAILSIARRADTPFTDEDLEKITKMVDPFTAGLLMVRRANRKLTTHARESLSELLWALTRPRGMVAALVALLLAAAISWFCLGTLPYHVTATAAVTAVSERHYDNPHDAILAEAPFSAGDRVLAGQVLYRLDTTDLELERNRLLAELAVAEISIARAMTDAEDRSAVSLARAEREVLRAQLAEIERRIERSAPIAPADGVILRGDLRRRVGEALARGTPMLAFAADSDEAGNGRKLKLRLPEVDADDIAAGMKLRFVSLADPEASLTASIERISPTAEPHRDGIVFTAEAEIDADQTLRPDLLRPGMEGVVSISAGQRPVWWLALHKAIDYMRLKLWL